MKGQSQSSLIRTKRSKSKSGKAASAPDWTVAGVLAELKRCGEQRNVEGMAHFGIRTEVVLGVSKPQMDEIARKIGRNHDLGRALWETGIHEGKLLGMLISERERVTATQMELWLKGFDNWDVCDGTCCHLFVFAKPAWSKAQIWTKRKGEFEKRAGFALAAYLAIHDKTAKDAAFRPFLKAIEREAWDERNFVRKAVNWALRNIGKRNQRLNREAITAAERIRKEGTKTGRWIAADALRELKSEAVQQRLREKAKLAR